MTHHEDRPQHRLENAGPSGAGLSGSPMASMPQAQPSEPQSAKASVAAAVGLGLLLAAGWWVLSH